MSIASMAEPSVIFPGSVCAAAYRCERRRFYCRSGNCRRYVCLFEFDFLVTHMSYSKKERVLRSLRREPVDRLPTQSNYTRVMGRLLSEHFGFAEAELPERLGNHLLRVDIDHPRHTNGDGS